MLSGIRGDLRFAARQLRRAPGYALTVGLTVALAVGSVAALTSVLRATLWSRLPFAEADRLLVLQDRNVHEAGADHRLMTMARFADVQALQQNGKPVMKSVANFFLNPTAIALTGEQPRAVQQAGVSDDFFGTLQAPPLLGRTLSAADNVWGAPLHVVISYGLWQSEFGGDPHVIGRAVRLGDEQGTLVGVMGRSFAYPAGVDVWSPGRVKPTQFAGYRGEASRYLMVVGRVAAGQTVASVTAALEALAHGLAERYPATDAAWVFHAESMRDATFGSYKQALRLLAASLLVLLLVVVLNLASLQLTRSVARQAEFRLRTALGVREGRLLQQMVTENAFLLGSAGLAGLGLAVVFLRVLVAQVPKGLLAVDTPHLDWAAVGATTGFCALASTLTSVVSWRMSLRARHTLGVATSAARVLPAQTVRMGRVLAVCQMALAFVLLAFSATVLHALYELLRAPLGFQTEHVVTFTVDRGWNGDRAKVHQFYTDVEERLRVLPGVQAVGAMTALPLNAFQMRSNYDVQGRPLTPKHDTISAETRGMSAGLLRAMQIPLLAGRPLTARDGDAHAPQVVMVNEALVRRYFAGVPAVGQRLLVAGGVQDGAPLSPAEIVGVVADVRGTGGGLTQEPTPEVYFAEDGGWPHMQFAVRSDRDRNDMEAAARAVVASLDASATIGTVATLQSTVHTAEQQPLLNAELLTLFAGFGLLLVMVGVYGLAAFHLSQRVREFAVRMALGCSREAVFRLMLGDAVRVLLFGLPLGAAGAFLLAHVLRAAVPVGASLPVWTYPAVAAVLVLCALGATLHPARRAASVDPMEGLRAE